MTNRTARLTCLDTALAGGTAARASFLSIIAIRRPVSAEPGIATIHQIDIA
jgi:hypothetical protein